MKTQIYRASDRGFANYGWLQANYSFSFANYFNPDKLHFGALRVLNDDLIAPSMGFGTHPHDNMEIITIPLKGVLKHRDSMHDNWQEVHPDEVQVMSAGSGLKHSEINGSPNEHLSLFQIWIMPDERNVEPRYDQKKFDAVDRKNNLQTLVTGFDDDFQNSLKVHQDIRISRIDLEKGKELNYEMKSSSHGLYLMVIHGEIAIGEEALHARDAIGISNTSKVEISATELTELLLIEVPMISLN